MINFLNMARIVRWGREDSKHYGHQGVWVAGNRDIGGSGTPDIQIL